jgi:hypothetical protein
MLLPQSIATEYVTRVNTMCQFDDKAGAEGEKTASGIHDNLVTPRCAGYGLKLSCAPIRGANLECLFEPGSTQ